MEIAQLPIQTPATLKLVFAEVGLAPTVELGPFAQVRIDGGALRTNDGEILAVHLSHSWQVGEREFFRLDCDSPVRLHFENEQGESSAVAGPFMHFSCADGIAYADGIIYGNIDLESKLWFGHQGRRYWRELVVKSASSPAS